MNFGTFVVINTRFLLHIAGIIVYLVKDKNINFMFLWLNTWENQLKVEGLLLDQSSGVLSW